MVFGSKIWKGVLKYGLVHSKRAKYVKTMTIPNEATGVEITVLEAVWKSNNWPFFSQGVTREDTLLMLMIPYN